VAVGRLTIFAKGNVDVRDVLHACRHGDEVVWNGVNEVLRPRFPGVVARIRHEIASRSDAIAQAPGDIPASAAAKSPPVGAYTLASQFGRAVLDTPSDVVVLSLQPDVMQNLARHRHEGYLFYPHDFTTWPAEAKAWLKRDFEPVPLLQPDDSMANFARIIDAIRAGPGAHVLIFNLSAVTPGELVHDYFGLAEDLVTRIRRFNLALVELSRATGVSVIDVDALVAREGASRLKFDPVHLTGPGCRIVAEEVVRVLADLGALPTGEGEPSNSA
jgi:hypothetical protein